MTKSFNLVEQPWIPIAGEARMRSLAEVFTAPAPLRLSGNAVDKIVLFRLLLSIVHASNEVPDIAAWRALTPEKLAANARDYLREHKSEFDLYGDRPFLQFPQLKGKETPQKDTSYSSLLLEVATGISASFTGWNQERPLSEAKKAQLILRSVCYAIGGKKYDQKISLTKGLSKAASGSAGTLLGKQGHLHTYLIGNNLWESFHLNMLAVEEIAKTRGFPNGMGRPAWEVMPQGEDDGRAQNYRWTYFGRLLPLDKYLLLTDSGIIKTDGIPYSSKKGTFVDPAITTYNDGKENKTVRVQTTKKPWRELQAILGFLNNWGSNACPPFFLSLGLAKIKPTMEWVRVWSGGLEVSWNAGEQYVSGTNDYVESEFELPCGSLSSQWLSRYQELMKELQKISEVLCSSVKRYHKKMKVGNGNKLASNATTVFWELLEPHSPTIINLAAECDEAKTSREKNEWKNIATDIYDQFCPNATERQMMVWAENRPKTNYRKKEEVQ